QLLACRQRDAHRRRAASGRAERLRVRWAAALAGHPSNGRRGAAGLLAIPAILLAAAPVERTAATPVGPAGMAAFCSIGINYLHSATVLQPTKRRPLWRAMAR